MRTLSKKDFEHSRIGNCTSIKTALLIETNEEATVNVRDVDLFVALQLLEDTPPLVFFMGGLKVVPCVVAWVGLR